MTQKIPICGIIHNGGRFGESLACGYLEGHAGAHSWASIPTFEGNGLTASENAANKLLSHIAEFSTILSQEYVDALETAVEYDTREWKARMDSKQNEQP